MVGAAERNPRRLPISRIYTQAWCRIIAADLHDTIGQNLAIARMKLGVLGRKAEDDEAAKMIRVWFPVAGEAIREGKERSA